MLHSWLKKERSYPKPPPGLPDPNSITDAEIAEEQAAINKEVTSTPTRKRKRGQHNHYDVETRAKITRYTQDHGNTRAVRHFSALLACSLNEASVRSMKKKLITTTKANPFTPVTSLPQAKT